MIRERINQIKQKISTTESQLFERVNKTTKPQTRLTKKKRKRIQVNKVRNESGEIITYTTEIQNNNNNNKRIPLQG